MFIVNFSTGWEDSCMCKKVDKFKNTLEEGNRYLIKNLLVAQNDVKFRTRNHKLELTFINNTICSKVVSTEIPELLDQVALE